MDFLFKLISSWWEILYTDLKHLTRSLYKISFKPNLIGTRVITKYSLPPDHHPIGDLKRIFHLLCNSEPPVMRSSLCL